MFLYLWSMRHTHNLLVMCGMLHVLLVSHWSSSSVYSSSTRQAVRPRAKSPEPPDTAAVISSKSRYEPLPWSHTYFILTSTHLTLQYFHHVFSVMHMHQGYIGIIFMSWGPLGISFKKYELVPCFNKWMYIFNICFEHANSLSLETVTQKFITP